MNFSAADGTERTEPDTAAFTQIKTRRRRTRLKRNADLVPTLLCYILYTTLVIPHISCAPPKSMQ